MADCGAFGFGRFRVARIHFRAGAGFEAVEQVVRFHALAFAAAHVNVLLLGVLRGNFVAHFLRAARREGDHVVSEVFQMVRFFVITKCAQACDNNLLRIGLARVNHVEHVVRVAERRSAGIVAIAGSDPGFVAVGMLVKALIMKIAVE